MTCLPLHIGDSVTLATVPGTIVAYATEAEATDTAHVWVKFDNGPEDRMRVHRHDLRRTVLYEGLVPLAVKDPYAHD